MLVRSLLSFGLFSALALATTTSEAASTSASTSAAHPTGVLAGAGNATGATCFWSNGTAASPQHLLPCKTSLGKDGVFACCPPQGANDLYPLDYPICTDNGLCQAGNSPFLARGGCTDKTGKSKSCPQYCSKSKKSGMTGLTNCQGRSPYFCCDDEHDAGKCNCSPPNGTAFQLDGTTPLFWKDLISKGGNTTAGVAGASASGCGTVHLTTTTTVMAPPSDSTQPAATSTIIATPPKPSGSQAAASKAISSSNPAATNFINFGLAALAAVGVAAI